MKNKSEFLTLKSVTLSNKTIELLFSTEKKLFARVTQQDGTVTLTSYIEGIPPIVKQDIVTLRNFIDNSHLVVNPSEENGKHSFVIHVNGSLKGGMLSGPFNKASEASDAFSRAKIEQARKDYSSAVNSYREAIIQLDAAKIKKGFLWWELAYDRSEQDELNKMLKDAHFNLAVSLVNLDNDIEQLEEALKHFKIAKNSGMQDESRKEMIAVHLQLAKKFETHNNPTLQKTHLKEAVELGSDEAKIQLNEIEQKAQMLKIRQHEEGQGHVIRVPWLNTFATGRGIKSTEQLTTTILVENMSLTKNRFQNTIEFFEYVIFDQHDLEKITRLETGISMNAGLWHLKAIAEYASKLELNKNSVYCVTGTVCSSPEQDGFSKGKLNDAALLQLKNNGFQKFKEKYGPHFIGGFSSGALFLGCITLKTENEKAARYLKTELTGPAMGLFQAGLSIERNLTETIKKSVSKIDITMQGLDLKNFNSSGSVTNLEEMREKHKQFQRAICDAGNLGPVEAICEPWESLPEVLAFINTLPTWNPKVRDPKLTLLEAEKIDSLDYLNALEEFPSDVFILYNLARSLPADDKIKLLDGTSMTQQELYLKTINIDNKFAEAYFNLSYTFPADGTIKLLDGTSMTQQELYLKIIDLDNKFADAYFNLAYILPAEGTIKLLDGTTMTDQELYLKAIDLDNKIAEAYYRLAYNLPADGTIKLLDGTSMTQQELYLKTIDLDNKFAEAYYRLAYTFPADGTIKLLDGTSMTQQELYLKTIDLDNKFAKAYYRLAKTLPADGTIKLLDGTSMTQQELYLKAIDLDNKFAKAYFNLAYTLPANDTIKLLDGTTMTDQELYLKAIDLDNKIAEAYYRLAYTFPAEGTIKLLDGTTMTDQELYLKTIDLDNKFAKAYYRLAKTLPDDGTIKLLDGTTMTQQELYLKTIDLDNKFAKAYFKLAYTLPADGTIKLLDGTSMTQQELYLKTINLDNKFANAYFNLAYTLPADGTIKLLDGTSMTKQKLYLKTIDLDNKFAKAYFNLAYTLPADGTIKLLDGTSMTKQKLYLKTIDLDNKNTNAYNNLARTLSADEDVKLLNGSTMNKKTLKQRTDHLKNENSIALNEDAGSSLLSKAAQQNDPVKSIIIQTSSGLKAISTVQSNNNAALPTTLQVQKNDATTLKK